jgi:AraC family transcriptional regulator, transcriptional activator of pobA
MESIVSHATKIPIVKPSQFDEYLFANWKAPVFGLYDSFHIERIENYKNYLVLPTPPHRRSVNFFLFITQGKAVRSKGLTKYELNSNQFFFLPAHQITSVELISEDVKGFYCHFLPEIFNQSLIKSDWAKTFPFFQIMENPVLEVEDNQRFIEILETLLLENQRNEPSRFSTIPLNLLLLFTEVQLQGQKHETTIPNAATEITQKYKNALSELIYEKKNVAEFAEYLSISPNHLHKSVKASTGKSAHQLLDEMRILEAKVLLRQSNLSIGEIAFKIGKFDPSDFSRFFKTHTNLTPNQYRKEKTTD